MSVLATLPAIPSYVVLIRFEPTAESDYPAYRLVNDEEKRSMAALFDEVKANTEGIYIVDLTGKSFCGTMRLGHLIKLQQALRTSGRILRIAADHKELLDVFRLTRLNTIMCVSNSLAEAVADALRPI
ncbi:MAG: anti-sigma factor antagonist [Phycisphaerae bacterium]|nr:anti-sigma factor antagonist [Phycisphaerae bacterium]